MTIVTFPTFLTTQGGNLSLVLLNCENICHLRDIKICQNLTLPRSFHYGALGLIWAMLLISCLEGLMERYFKFMPFNMFYQKKIPLRYQARKSYERRSVEILQINGNAHRDESDSSSSSSFSPTSRFTYPEFMT